MLIRRITLRLPAHLRHTAGPEARLLAEALATHLHATGATAPQVAVSLPAQGQSGPVLAARLAAALPKGGRHGG